MIYDISLRFVTAMYPGYPTRGQFLDRLLSRLLIGCAFGSVEKNLDQLTGL